MGMVMQENDGRVVSNFIVQSLNNKDITIYGDGSQTRSFCYVNDLISGLIKFKLVNLSEAENLYKLYNMETQNILSQIR